MYTIAVHDDAKAHARVLLNSDPERIKQVLAFLQEVKGCPEVMERLFNEGYEDEYIHVDAVSVLQRRRFNVFRMKLRGLDMFLGCPDEWEDTSKWMKYRIFYAPDDKGRVVHVLAIVERTEDTYESNDPRIRRIQRSYEALGLPLLPYSFH